MKTKDIKQFIKLASGKNISIFYLNSKRAEFFMSTPKKLNCFFINRYYKVSDEYFKMALLHEIGHIKYGMSEYKAQIWAINKAKKLNLPKVAKEGVKTITKYWAKINPPHCYKEHHHAYKIYRKYHE